MRYVGPFTRLWMRCRTRRNRPLPYEALVIATVLGAVLGLDRSAGATQITGFMYCPIGNTCDLECVAVNTGKTPTTATVELHGVDGSFTPPLVFTCSALGPDETCPVSNDQVPPGKKGYCVAKGAHIRVVGLVVNGSGAVLMRSDGR